MLVTSTIRLGSVVLLAVLTSLAAAGCTAPTGGSEPQGTSSSASVEPRSTEAFCSALSKHKKRYLASTSAAQTRGGLAGLVGTVAAVGDLRLMWQDLAEHAPEEIRLDAESVRDAWLQQEKNAASNDIAASLATALLYSGSAGRVDAYVRAECDEDRSAADETPLRDGIVLMTTTGTSVTLEAVDPESGETASGPTFTGSTSAVPDVAYVTVNGGWSVAVRRLFSPDYSAMAASAAGESNVPGAQHVGWLTQDGTFTDVSALTDSSDFSSAWSDDTPAFDPNGVLYFARREPEPNDGYKAPPTMMRFAPRDDAPEEVTEQDEEVNYTIVPGGDPRPHGAGDFPFMPTTTDGRRGCWSANDVQGQRCLASDENQVVLTRAYSIDADTSDFITPGGLTLEGDRLLPETNLEVSSPVFSPDGETIAFFASDPGGTTNQRLFTVAASGGQPTQVSDTTFPEDVQLVGWK